MVQQVRVLGALEVESDDGRVLSVTAPRQRALLALLASRAPSVVSVDTIIDQLWPEGPGDGAVGTVQAYVSYLRRVVEPRTIVTRAPGYALAVDRDQVDAHALVAAASSAATALADGRPDLALTDAERGLALVRGEPYADQGDLPFAVAERLRLSETVTALTEIAGQAESLLGRHGPAVARLSAVVDADPLRESAAAALMAAQFRSGNQAAALATFDTTRRALADELGVDPSPQLAAMHQRVLAQDPALEPARPALAALPAAPVVDDFVGRAAEQAVLLGLLDAGRGLALVSGEAGIGKSRLVRRVAAAATGRGWTAVTAQSWDDEGAPPLAAWVQLVTGLGVAELPRTVASLVDGTAEPGERTQLVSELADVVRAQPAPLLLVLEDVHWAGVETLALLRDLLVACDDRLAVVCTLRTEDTPSDVEHVLGQLRRLGARTVELGALAADEVASLVEAVADEPLTDQALQSVVQRSGGNPFFAVELTRAARQRGGGDVPEGVRDLVLWRSARLPEATTTLLQTAAVLGRRFDSDLLATVSGETVDDVYETLEPAAAAGLLTLEDGVGFAHALVRDAFYDTMPLARRRRAHLRTADVLEELHGEGGGLRAPEVVHHLDAAGGADPDRLVTALLASARLASGRFAGADARMTLLRARGVLAHQPVTDSRLQLELDVSLALATLSAQRHGYAAPETAAERARAAALVERVGGRTALLAATVGASSYATVSARFEEGLQHGQRLLELGGLGRDPVFEAAGLLQVTWVHWHRGEMTRARDGFAQLREVADALPAPLPLDALIQHPAVMARALGGCAATQCGDPLQGRALCTEAVAVAAATDHPFSQAMAGLFAAWRCFVGRDLPELVTASVASLQAGTEQGFPNIVGPSLALLGWGRVLLGDADGEEMVVTAQQAMRESGARFLGGFFGGLLGECALLRGALAEARDQLTAGLEACDSTGERFYEAELWRLLAAVERAEGRPGVPELDRAVEVATAQGSQLYADRARADLASLRLTPLRPHS